jgi:hypothetical protein
MKQRDSEGVKRPGDFVFGVTESVDFGLAMIDEATRFVF